MITRTQFAAYDRVRKSGKFNMWLQQDRAARAAGLSPEAYGDIWVYYEIYAARWPDVRERIAQR